MTELVCIGCPKGCHLEVDEENDYKVTGNSCNVGAEYGRNELRNPVRILTTTVAIKGACHNRLPVKTSKPIPKGRLFEAMESLKNVEVNSPVECGQVIVSGFMNADVDVIATRKM